MEQENEASTPEVRSCIVQGTMNLKKQKQNKQEIKKKTNHVENGRWCKWGRDAKNQ